MRKVILFLNMSLDGVVSGVEEWADINSALMDESIERYKRIDTVIFGGATFPGMSEYWQKAAAGKKETKERTLARALNATTKIALTNQPMEIDWEKSAQWIVKTEKELGKKIAEIKKKPGKTISVESGVRTWRKFIAGNFYDELHIIVQPVITGKGDKLFDGDLAQTKLKLVSETKIKGGLIKLVYAKAI